MAVEFESVKQPKLAEIIAARVREDIRTGRLPVGAQLPPEHELIDQFGVSRGTMREALMLLESQQFIEIRTGRRGGAIVTQPTAASLASTLDVMLGIHDTPMWHLLEARGYVEPIAAELACQRATEEDLQRLQTSVERMDKAWRDGDEAAYREETISFHVLIAEAAHNNLIRALTVMTQELIFSKAHKRLTADASENIRAHETILAAIAAGDSEAAVRRMGRHVHAFEASVLKSGPTAVTERDDEV